MSVDVARVERQLSLQFQDHSLLEQALSHRSMGAHNNERLEFLGDSILGYIMADALFHQFPEADEGVLSRLRASLVNQKSLAELALVLDLGDCLILGPGELKSGGFRRHSILSDALEAIIGALYKDQGMSVCSEWVRQLFAEKLGQLNVSQVLKDPKTRLQEKLQAQGQPLPEYHLEKTTGQAHQQTFFIECQVQLLPERVCAKGASRRQAEQLAAQKILALLDDA